MTRSDDLQVCRLLQPSYSSLVKWNPTGRKDRGGGGRDRENASNVYCVLHTCKKSEPIKQTKTKKKTTSEDI